MRSKKSIMLAVIAAIAFAACEPDEQGLQPEENVSESALNFLAMRRDMSPINALSSKSALSETYKQLLHSGRMRTDTFPTDTFPGDTIPTDTIPTDTIPGDTTGYVSCAEVTTKFNRDGSITTIVDYGDGCEEGWPPYLQFLFGRHTTTSKNEINSHGDMIKNRYFYDNKFERFGGRYAYGSEDVEWYSDGTTHDEGSAQYSADSLSGSDTYNGEFEHSENLTSVWNGQSFTTKGSSLTQYNAKESVVKRSDFTYTNGGDYFYSVKVLKPLVSLNDCPSATYVSGVESVRYNINGQQGSFEINYGDGECDSIVTIIEKGKRKKVDLSAPGL